MQLGIIDVELFHSNVVKELAVCTSSFTRCVSFLPPSFWENLTKKEKMDNLYLTNKLHNIQWGSGNLPYTSLPIVVEIFTLPGIQYYAKGEQKCQLLSELFQRDVRNLEDIGCPAISMLANGDINHAGKCQSYPHGHRNTLHCAQKKATTYYKWLTQCCIYL